MIIFFIFGSKYFFIYFFLEICFFKFCLNFFDLLIGLEFKVGKNNIK